MTSTYHLLSTGSNSSSQLGLNHTTDISTFSPCIFLSSSGVPLTREDNPLERGWKVRDLCSGAGHSLCILQPPLTTLDGRGEENQVWVCGSNEFGQLGIGREKLMIGWRRLDLDGLIGGLRLDSLERDSGNKRDRRRSTTTTATGKTTSSTNQNDRYDRRIRYKPTLIACSWTTSFIVLSRHISSSPPPPIPFQPSKPSPPSQPSQQSSRLSDIILSFGSNDNSELGTTTLPLQDSKIHQVNLPTPPNVNEIYIVNSITAGQRSICCLIDVYLKGKGGVEVGNEIKIERDGDGDGDGENGKFVRQLIFGWGSSRHGQLSPSSSSSSSSYPTPQAGPSNPKSPSQSPAKPSHHPLKPKSKYPKAIIQPSQINLLPPHEEERKVKSVALGVTHSVFLLDDGEVVGLGSNLKCQLSRQIFSGVDVGGREDKERKGTKYTDVKCTWNGTFLVSPRSVNDSDEIGSRGDRVISIGSNTHGQLGRGDSVIRDGDRDGDREKDGDGGGDGDEDGSLEVALGSEGQGLEVVKLVCGSEHVLVLYGSSSSYSSSSARTSLKTRNPVRLKVWGWNEHGNLGLGDKIDRWRPVSIGIEDILRGMGGVDRSVVGDGRDGWTITDCWAGCGTSWVLVQKD